MATFARRTFCAKHVGRFLLVSLLNVSTLYGGHGLTTGGPGSGLEPNQPGGCRSPRAVERGRVGINQHGEQRPASEEWSRFARITAKSDKRVPGVHRARAARARRRPADDRGREAADNLGRGKGLCEGVQSRTRVAPTRRPIVARAADGPCRAIGKRKKIQPCVGIRIQVACRNVKGTAVF